MRSSTWATRRESLRAMIPGRSDGKVSVESAKVEGMKAFKVIHAAHPVIMNQPGVIKDVVQFLKFGSFDANPSI
ncbi:hypothetical protein IQ241_22750 [Romeria aff. gracilis LEGE 07310]|uniref:Uncharacterized protein n=1 Tax=Vasconcelosia minhoensis LEGE 07310 TaxID=915328 RepID=A0A8J7DPQ0_9CYAN|nr:hypothetical protein [Romeria gracilis]MBE9080075.1 hypothetical protein [Romeria aff. gracilis LEGE 07310]